MLIYGHLPTQELVDSKSIAAAGFVERKKPAANSGDHFCLPAYDPSPRRHGRQIGNGQGTPIGADDIFDTRTIRLGHIVTHILERSHSNGFIGAPL
jgi:hypothetical protein